MSAKISKLQNQFQSIEIEKESSRIFEGISIYVNGYTEPSSDTLKQLMRENGGSYHHYYSRKFVSHIIATNLPKSKIVKLTDQKVVKPSWITESIKAQKLLPYTDFLVVPVDTRMNNQKTLNFTKTVTFEHKNTNEPKTPSKSPIKSAYDLSPAKNKNFVSDFYSRSRLHHISNWGAEFKEYVNGLQKLEDKDFPERESLRELVQNEGLEASSEGKLRTTFMHIDMDCFFVSVGLRNRPDLVGLYLNLFRIKTLSLSN